MKLAAEIRSGGNKLAASSIPTNGLTNGGTGVNPVTGYLHATAGSRSRIYQESDVDAYLEAFEHLARRLVFRAFDHLQQLRQRGRMPEEAWNETGVELSRVIHF
jgi:hypothetical protein